MSAEPRIDGVDDLVEIGRGGFGVVYRGVEARYGRQVAVKLLTAHFDEHAAARFDRELRAMGTVTGHPNIVTVFRDGDTADGQPYLVMEFLAGGSMQDMLDRDGPIDWRSAASIGAKLADALEAAHAVGIVHRDVKPDNVFRTATGEPKLGDFGIARLDGGFETRTGQITASLAHAPPEVLEGHRPDVRADLYSLASTIYSMVAGHSPFETEHGVSIATLIGRIATQPVPELQLEPAADRFCAVLRSALSKVPAERPESAARFAELLRACVQVDGRDAPVATTPAPHHQPAPATTPSQQGATPASAARNPSRRWAIGAAALVIAAGLLGAAAFLLVRSDGGAGPGLLELSADEPNPDAFVVTTSSSGDPADADLTGLILDDVAGTITTVRGDAPGLYAASLTDDPCDRETLVSGLGRDLDRSQAWATAAGTTTANIGDRIDALAGVFLKAEILVDLAGYLEADASPVTRPALLAPGTAVLVDDFGVPRVRCLDGSPIAPPSGVPAELDPERDVISIVPGARMADLDVDDVDAPGGGLLAVGSDRAARDRSVAEPQGADDSDATDEPSTQPGITAGADPLPTVEFGSQERFSLEPGPVTIRLGDRLMSFVLRDSHEVLSQDGHLVIHFDDPNAEVDVFRPLATDLRFELATADDVATYLLTDSRFGDVTELATMQFNGLTTRVFQATPDSFLAFHTTPQVAETVGWRSPPLLRLWLVDAPGGPVVVTAESLDEDLVQFDETTAVALEVLGSMNFRSR